MHSEIRSHGRKNQGDNVFRGIPVGNDEPWLFLDFIHNHSYSRNKRGKISQDMRTFARWFTAVHQEPFTVGRVTAQDIFDFRNHLVSGKMQPVAAVNRRLASLQRFFDWLAEEGYVDASLGEPVGHVQPPLTQRPN